MKDVRSKIEYLKKREFILRKLCRGSSPICFLTPRLNQTALEMHILAICLTLRSKKNQKKPVVIEVQPAAPSPLRKKIESVATVINVAEETREMIRDVKRKFINQIVDYIDPKSVVFSGPRFYWLKTGADPLFKTNFRSEHAFFFCEKGQPEGGKKDPDWAKRLSGRSAKDLTVITDNLYTLNRLKKVYGVKQVHLLPPPLFLSPKPKEERKKTRSYASKIKVLWASRIDPQKRPETVLALAKMLRRKYPGSEIHFYGSSVHLPSQSLLRKMRSTPGVVFHGAYSEFSKIPLHRFHFFVYASRYDGQPMTLLEAMRAGLPILCPKTGGITEIAEAKRSYAVDHLATPKDYFLKSQEIVENPEAAKLKASRAQKWVIRHYSENAYRARLKKIKTLT